MTESQATTKLLKYLKEYGFFWKASDKFQAGIPDIIGVYVGRFMAIEMKIDSNTATALQIYNMVEMSKNEAYTAVVTYNNKSKTWWVRGKSFDHPRLIAKYLTNRSRFAKDDFQN